MNEAYLFRYARDRERVRLDKEAGLPFPWTDDHIMTSFHFGNVHREHDTNVKWVKENILGIKAQGIMLTSLFAFHQFGRIAVTEQILHILQEGWDSVQVEEILCDVSPLSTTSRPIKTRGKTQIEAICVMVEDFSYNAHQMLQYWDNTVSLEGTHIVISNHYPPSAAEMVYDLQGTSLLADATDVETWVHPSPATIRGLGRLTHGNYMHYKRADGEILIRALQGIQAISHGVLWPGEPWSLQTTERTVGNFDMYCRAKENRRKPIKYKGGQC